MNPYQEEINEAKFELNEAFELAQSINPQYNVVQYVDILKKELKSMTVKLFTITRSGGHPSDELRIAYFAHEQLVAELQ